MVICLWSEVQTCIWPSWCHCHSLSLASVKSRLVYLSGTSSPGYPGQTAIKWVYLLLWWWLLLQKYAKKFSSMECKMRRTESIQLYRCIGTGVWEGNGTFRIPLLFSEFRRFGPPGGANVGNYGNHFNMSMNSKSGSNKVAHSSPFVLIHCVQSAFSPDQSVSEILKLLKFRSLLHGYSAADVSPAHDAPPSFVRYTNRPFAHQRRNTKRLTISESWRQRCKDRLLGIVRSIKKRLSQWVIWPS